MRQTEWFEHILHHANGMTKEEEPHPLPKANTNTVSGRIPCSTFQFVDSEASAALAALAQCFPTTSNLSISFHRSVRIHSNFPPCENAVPTVSRNGPVVGPLLYSTLLWGPFEVSLMSNRRGGKPEGGHIIRQ